MSLEIERKFLLCDDNGKLTNPSHMEELLNNKGLAVKTLHISQYYLLSDDEREIWIRQAWSFDDASKTDYWLCSKSLAVVDDHNNEIPPQCLCRVEKEEPITEKQFNILRNLAISILDKTRIVTDDGISIDFFSTKKNNHEALIEIEFTSALRAALMDIESLRKLLSVVFDTCDFTLTEVTDDSVYKSKNLAAKIKKI